MVAWLLVASYLLGRYYRERLGLEIDSSIAEFSISSGIGLGTLGCVLFVLGLLRGYYPAAFLVLLAIPCIAFYRKIPHLLSRLRGLHRRWASAPEFGSSWVGLLMVFFAIFLLFTLLVALAPSIAVDAMQDHLPTIRHYTVTHTLSPVPELPYSYYPQSVEVLMTLVFGLGGQPAAQLVNPMFFALTLMLTFSVARRCELDLVASLTGTVVVGTIPFLHWTGSILKNDLPLAFFQLAALYCYLRVRASNNPNWLRLGVFFLAMSFGVKHVALFGGGALGILYLHAVWKGPERWRRALSLIGVFVVFGVFWHIRTFWLTGNPVFPMKWNTAVTRELEVPTGTSTNPEERAMCGFRGRSISRVVRRKP